MVQVNYLKEGIYEARGTKKEKKKTYITHKFSYLYYYYYFWRAARFMI